MNFAEIRLHCRKSVEETIQFANVVTLINSSLHGLPSNPKKGFSERFNDVLIGVASSQNVSTPKSPPLDKSMFYVNFKKWSSQAQCKQIITASADTFVAPPLLPEMLQIVPRQSSRVGRNFWLFVCLEIIQVSEWKQIKVDPCLSLCLSQQKNIEMFIVCDSENGIFCGFVWADGY